MWTLDNNRIRPLLPYDIDGQPSTMIRKLARNLGSKRQQIAKTEVVFKYGQITGKYNALFTNEHGGFDINNEKIF